MIPTDRRCEEKSGRGEVLTASVYAARLCHCFIGQMLLEPEQPVYRLLTRTCWAAFLTSSRLLTFCTVAVRASISFCCCATVTACFALLDFSSAIVACCSSNFRCAL